MIKPTNVNGVPGVSIMPEHYTAPANELHVPKLPMMENDKVLS